jgi:predicted RNA-binding protein YlxR (DUF448 family)
MVNRNSQAGHIPLRSCVICREKTSKVKLLRFLMLDGEIIFDPGQKIAARGYYVCDNNACIEKLEKWKTKKKVRNIKKK